MVDLQISCAKASSSIQVSDEAYSERIVVFKFYTNCSDLSAKIIIKTDPKNSDYAVEPGANRNFEPWQGVGVGGEDVEMKRTRAMNSVK
ncbi:hypothetical protein C1H46_005636 [Malus baccata]|uniref:Uncharacterized protein n=1 Tax=Malus baccata TaxID=106549 RepID=A0A540NCN6_MALBA|nr:hypothetical protein C1H46_005636 [Malus baccata]